MKGLRIFNIILFSLICILESLICALFIYILALLLSGNLGGALASVFFIASYFVCGCGILLVFNIVITITARISMKKTMAMGKGKTKFDKLCILLPWLFLVLDIILFIAYYVIAIITGGK